MFDLVLNTPLLSFYFCDILKVFCKICCENAVNNTGEYESVKTRILAYFTQYYIFKFHAIRNKVQMNFFLCYLHMFTYLENFL